MTKQGIFAIIISVLLSLAAAYSAASVKTQDIDTRERLNAEADARDRAETERALERVAATSDQHIERVERVLNDKVGAMHQDVQWLIKAQTETTAIVRRIERRDGGGGESQ